METLKAEGKFKGTFIVGDALYFNSGAKSTIDRLTHTMDFDGNVEVTTTRFTKDGFTTVAANIHFFKENKGMTFDLVTGELTHEKGKAPQEKQLGWDTSSFLVGTPDSNVNVSTSSEGHYGFIFHTANEAIVHVCLTEMDVASLHQTLQAAVGI